jgi:hypothetical protein
MAKPFISFDGADASGVRAEVWVEKGTGTVRALEESKTNVLVKMAVENLKHPVQGWLSLSDPIYPVLKEAMESGREVAYRIESQRKNGVDRTTPISTLRATQESANDSTRRLFVGVDDQRSSEAVTHPAEDPHAGGRIPAPDPTTVPASQQAQGGAASGGGFSAQQALAGLASARQGGLPPSVTDAAAALALAAGATVEQVLSAGMQEQREPERRAPQRVVAEEAPPHVPFNSDGRMNLGSYTVQAAAGAEALAAKLMRAQATKVAEQQNAEAAEAGDDAAPVEVQPINYEQAALLGGVLLDLADKVQVAAYGGGRVNRNKTSHSRARSYVYDAVEYRYPIPFGGTAEEKAAWTEQVLSEATARFANVIRLADGGAQAPAQQAPAQQAPAQQAPAQQAPAQQGNAEVRQIGTNAAPKTKPPVEGEEGFMAPSDEVLQSFAALAASAGFEPGPDTPVAAYLDAKFGVTAARKVSGPALESLVTWFRAQGNESAAKFRSYVLAEAAPQEASA